MDDAAQRGQPYAPAPVALAMPPLGELAGDVSRRWLSMLVAVLPLQQTAALDLPGLAAEAPALCEAVLRAMEADAELEWLTTTPDGLTLIRSGLDLADVGGDDVAVVECLRRGALGALAARQAAAPSWLAQATDRLAHVCARLSGCWRGARILSGPEQRRGPLAAPAGHPPAPRGVTAADLATTPPPPLRSVGGRPEAPPLWMAALERRLVEGRRSDDHVSVLLLEIDGAERLELAHRPPSLEELLAAVGSAIRERVRRADLLAHEAQGRLWVTAGDAGRAGGRALGARLAGAVQRSGRLRGTPLTASVGLALFPEDGRDAGALVAVAEEQMYAARAAGTTLVGQGPDEPVSDGA